MCNLLLTNYLFLQLVVVVRKSLEVPLNLKFLSSYVRVDPFLISLY